MRLPRFVRRGPGAVGLAIAAAIVLIAVVGPLFAPHDITEAVGAPGQPPTTDALLGTDALGRDVLSRMLHGGWSVLWISIAATLVAYAAGLAIGLLAGYSRNLTDSILMRGVDVLLAFPALLIVLLLVSGLGTHIYVIILGVAVALLPGIARLVRTATLETSTRGYVEAAIARGEPTRAILAREVLPNITPVILADLGVRYALSIILIASINYLGLGLAPPAADWGLMMSENRSYIALNVWSVLGPAIMLGLLTVAVNLLADSYVRTLGSSADRDELPALDAVVGEMAGAGAASAAAAPSVSPGGTTSGGTP